MDDDEQGITDVVRGEDLADNTPRQIALQRALGLPTPRYLHTPLVLAADGHKLSKQNGAAAIDNTQPVRCWLEAAKSLGLAANFGLRTIADARPALLEAWLTQIVRAP